MDLFGLLINIAAILALIHANHQSRLSITPSDEEVIHFVNESHFVLCNIPTDHKVQWRSPKGEIIKDKKGRIHIEAKSEEQLALVFEHISLLDKGNWSCAVEDGVGRAGFQLIVNQKISFMDTDTLQAVREGKDATIRCEVKGDPEPTVSWHLNGAPITVPSSKFTKLADGLLIKKVSQNDTGEYTCKAFQISERMNDVKEQTILLKIQHKPTWVHKDNPDRYGYIGGSVNLTCEAIAEPAANFTWYHHGKKINTQKFKIYNEPYATILIVPINDSSVLGDYKCKASNPLGNLDRTIKLLEGVQPNKPAVFQLRGFNSNRFVVDVGAVRINKERNLMDIKGYRIEYITEDDFKSVGGDWNYANRNDFAFEDGATYLINQLEENTTYLMRAASKNLAGFSNWTKVEKFTTLSNEPPKSSATIVTVPIYFSLYQTIGIFQIINGINTEIFNKLFTINFIKSTNNFINFIRNNNDLIYRSKIKL